MFRILLILTLGSSAHPAASAPLPRPGEVLNVEGGTSAPQVVLLPGLSGCAFGYRHVTDGLTAAGVSWAIVEPLAVGHSPRPLDADYSLTAQADRVAAVLSDLGDQPVVLVGHGVSGSIALRVALRHPGLVRSVVSIEGGPDEAAASPTVDRSLKWAGLAVKLGGARVLRDRFRSDLEAASGDPAWITGHVLRRYFAPAGRDLPAAIAALRAMARAEEPEALRPRLGSITQDVTLLVGGAPHACQVTADEVAVMRAGLPAFAIREVPGAGHFVFEEQPGVVVDLLLRLARVGLDRAEMAADLDPGSGLKGGR